MPVHMLPSDSSPRAGLGVPDDGSLARTVPRDYFWLQAKPENVIIIVFKTRVLLIMTTGGCWVSHRKKPAQQLIPTDPLQDPGARLRILCALSHLVLLTAHSLSISVL